MARSALTAALLALLAAAAPARASISEQVADLPTRPGVTQRVLVIAPEAPLAAVILLPGGVASHGLVGIAPDGRFPGEGTPSLNVLLRMRLLLAQQRLLVAVIDPPSDRMQAPFLAGGFRMTPEHAEDVGAVIAWLRRERQLPVWLIGHSSGTLSATISAARLGPRAGPDGVVLLSSMVTATRFSASLLDLPGTGRLRVPALVVHHRRDTCGKCKAEDLPRLLEALAAAPRKELQWVDGGHSVGDPCEAQSHHGLNGLESKVAGLIADWILGPR